jgi:hypothetical protein
VVTTLLAVARFHRLLERLDKGGMAEVYLARGGPMGISRFVARKRMLSDLPSERGDPCSSTRCTAIAAHPSNIVQVYDFVGGRELFSRHGFVEGRDIRSSSTLRKRPRPSTSELAVHHRRGGPGLDHAHRLTGPTGEPRR